MNIEYSRHKKESVKFFYFLSAFLIVCIFICIYLIIRLESIMKPGMMESRMDYEGSRILIRKLEDPEKLSNLAVKIGETIFQDRKKLAWEINSPNITGNMYKSTIEEYEKLFEILNRRKVIVIEK